ncbi:MAG: beta-propeller fold lactonase family protein [bacterium]
MKIEWRRRLFSKTGIWLIIGLGVVLGAGHRWSSEHVRYITGGQPASLNCISCHVYTQRNGWVTRLLQRDYLSPLDIAVSPDGSRLYVTAQDGEALLVVDPNERWVVTKIPVGQRPHSVVLSRDGTTAYVSNQWWNTISVIDLSAQRLVSTLEVGSGPAGLALGPEGKFLYVANSFSDDLSVLDLSSGLELKRLLAGRNPYAVQLSPDGQVVCVTSRLSNHVAFRTPPVSEVTLVSTRLQRVVERKMLYSAHLLEGIAFAPEGDLALVTLVRPKNLLPATQVGRGWMVTHGVGIIEPGRDGRVAQVLLDDVNAFYADPYDIVITPDGQRAFVTHAGADYVTVVDIGALRRLLTEAATKSLATYANHLGLSSRYVIKRIPTGANPKGLALAPDARRLYVAERLADRIAIIDTEKMEMVGTIDLGGPQTETPVRQGQRLFNSASHTFQGQFSCRTCHPDGHEDGLTYDLEPDGLGRNLLNTRSLRDLADTAPFKWNGKNVSLYMQCGIRFAKFLTRSQPFTPDELSALVAFIMRSLSNPPNRYRTASGELSLAQQRGKMIFERTTTNDGRIIPLENRCITCHPPPLFTNRQKADVGTVSATDSPQEFDSPHLNNIYESAPYLHDGRAATLEEIWTKFNTEDRHGVSNDLTKDQLNDLIEYLRAL